MSKSYRSTKIACFVGFVVQAIINNFVNYTFGEGIISNYSYLSDEGESIEEVVQKCIR